MIKMTQKEIVAYYVGNKEQKTIFLPRTRISPKLLELINAHVKKNGLKNRSVFIRHALRKALNLSVQDVIDVSIPFMPRPPTESQLNE